MAQMKSVLSKEEADKIVVSYNPQKFPQSVSSTASHFVQFNTEHRSSFQIDEIVARQTGIAEIERLSIEEKVEREALEKLKDLQEQAYAEAYAIGLEEGREKAYADKSAEFEQNLEHFGALLASIENLKPDLISSNETQIMRLVSYLARRLAMTEIQEKPELVLEVIRQAIASAQSDETITVRVSPTDFAFIEATRSKLGKSFESLQTAKFEASEEILDGGCIVQTNYGDVDATMEQRFEKLWAAISEKLPPVHDVVGG